MTANLFLVLACLLPMRFACALDGSCRRTGALFCTFVILIPLGAAPLASIANIRFEGVSNIYYYLFVTLAMASILCMARRVAKHPRSALRAVHHVSLGALCVVVTLDAAFSAPESGLTPGLFDRGELAAGWIAALVSTGGLVVALCSQTSTRFTPLSAFISICALVIWTGAALTGLVGGA
ncbi:hypothetical protein [Hydrogenophaga luteola]|uniref:Uncharacterized protein n=1 Tax=Hydrogenophaga luteola TaxID=1591122 RepID=A0ABV7W1M6_9BURK